MHPDPSKLKQNIRTALRDSHLREAVRRATDHSLAKRDEAVTELPNWELLRDRAARIRDRSLAGLDRHLLTLEERLAAKGGQVHWARDGAEANRIIGDICRVSIPAKGVTLPVIAKSKSMTTEEIGLTGSLEKQGFEVVETDLGEYIVQIAGQIPSHITAPALHLSRVDIGKLFAEKLGVEYTDDPVELISVARKVLRRKFLEADIGITGANFAVAETGTPIMVENEGNGRLVSAVPKVQIVVMGIEKVVPTWDDLMPLLEVLPRSATGQRITGSVLFFNRPSAQNEHDGPRALHLVILDNGRTRALADPELRNVLRCIRCGACLNACPVYRRTGGHAYGWVYPGPIGAVLAPVFLGYDRAGDHPFASSLCGQCSETCPVKIDLHQMMLTLRERINSRKSAWTAEKSAMSTWTQIADRPGLYRSLAKWPRLIYHNFISGWWSPRLPVWGRERSGPEPAAKPFEDLFKIDFPQQEE
jgi:L-lactate dehydrogenase complex protein LldF